MIAAQTHARRVPEASECARNNILPFVSYGSKCEWLNLSTSWPLSLHKRTRSTGLAASTTRGHALPAACLAGRLLNNFPVAVIDELDVLRQETDGRDHT